MYFQVLKWFFMSNSAQIGKFVLGGHSWLMCYLTPLHFCHFYKIDILLGLTDSKCNFHLLFSSSRDKKIVPILKTLICMEFFNFFPSFF